MMTLFSTAILIAAQLTIYVNTSDGSDGNSGTEKCPVRTTRRAAKLVGHHVPWQITVEDRSRRWTTMLGGIVELDLSQGHDFVYAILYPEVSFKLPEKLNDPPTSGCEPETAIPMS